MEGRGGDTEREKPEREKEEWREGREEGRRKEVKMEE